MSDDASARGRSNRARGAAKEREIAQILGGKRNVMSGGSPLGGGDIAFDAKVPNIFADFIWEVKYRAKQPEWLRKSLLQAAAEGGIGHRKHPAAVLCAPQQRTIVAFYLQDFVDWSRALAEVGQGSHLRSVIRQIRRQLDELERGL